MLFVGYSRENYAKEASGVIERLPTVLPEGIDFPTPTKKSVVTSKCQKLSNM